MKNYAKLLVLASICLGLQGTALAAKDDAKKAPASAAASASASAKAELMDINSASKKELATLPKIGDARSDAIIKGRPYRGKDELLSRKILTEDVYNGIKDMIIAKQKTAEKK
ncbi:ComEA family DNA-binding protein [Undibacterium oligocarboniphilum]|uniref:Helix-hairpin-helix domain-containing protein n=1 Tax=Undibacterium oligocarboniphilum TaxID=666702 RepID=A0A850QCC9_9BURK|nr:helix-hairpin-helix domain-containing protein [Undibacterium oligocarboniphilum]MBC3870071.1 helix-hairpin-helix domain-containing protein [Undibacterium oligocarboniphilum]NVO78062.1 helix-hairpin-helix domain-containing protein [Undibacterium oligocarboniphilum]